MTRPQFRRADARPPCASLHADDGVEARESFRKASRRRDAHKDRRLCARVFEILSLVLPPRFHPGRDGEAWVESVAPAPDATRLLVTLRVRAGGPGLDATRSRVVALHGILRTEVAQGVRRKRAPEF